MPFRIFGAEGSAAGFGVWGSAVHGAKKKDLGFRVLEFRA